MGRKRRAVSSSAPWGYDWGCAMGTHRMHFSSPERSRPSISSSIHERVRFSSSLALASHGPAVARALSSCQLAPAPITRTCMQRTPSRAKPAMAPASLLTLVLLPTLRIGTVGCCCGDGVLVVVVLLFCLLVRSILLLLV